MPLHFVAISLVSRDMSISTCTQSAFLSLLTQSFNSFPSCNKLLESVFPFLQLAESLLVRLLRGLLHKVKLF